MAVFIKGFPMMMWFAHGLNNPWMLVSMLIVKVSHA
jgi:hypothetical protein